METILFVLAGDDLSLRLKYITHFDSNHHLFKQSLLSLDYGPANEPFTSAVVSPSQELIELLIAGRNNPQAYSASFPAKKITTKQTWDDLILEENVLKQIDEISAWVAHGHKLHTELDLGGKLTPGHRCLFYGPPGTGKTLTATLIGKQTGLDVYRIDLSQVVSKYIGETEKNLSKVFDRAESKNWILFFDEADALFGRRTSVKDAHDRFANQEVSYLLQRVEEYNGLVILATNFKSNIDDAFARRFQSVIHFPMPQIAQRKKLWDNMFPEKLEKDNDVDVSQLAEQYELSGGSIINIVRYCALMALTRNNRKIILPDITEGIKREFIKEGKAM
jgi:SpoVK/Ycf46/Vps4 family AAA+-type ATPase